MCGRFVSLSPPEVLALRFGIDEVTTPPLAARHNVAPSQDVYAILDHDGTRRLGTLRWGFVAPWSSDPARGVRPINARIEGVTGSRLFRDAVRRRRCVVPMDGFYEWRAGEEGAAKQPFHIASSDGGPFAVAAIRSSWRGDEGPALHTVALLTTQARGVAATVHHRMPVIVPVEALDPWLDTTDEDVEGLLAELGQAEPDLVAHAVSTRVNSVANDGPELVRAITV